MNADAKFLASRPERLPKGIAEIFQSVHRHTGIAQHVDAEMTRFDCALYLGDDCVDRAHKGNYCERDEPLARLTKLCQSVVVGAHAGKLELGVVVKESSARPVGK